MGTEIDKKIIDGLQRLTLVVRHLLWKVSQENGLTPLQTQILILIGDDEKSLREYAEYLKVKLSTLSDAISSLEEKGYVTKITNPMNRRVRHLKLTNKGRRHVKRIRNWSRSLEETLAKLNILTKEGGWLFILRLISELVRSGVIQDVQMCFLCKYFIERVEGTFYCKFLEEEIPTPSLRLECPDFEPVSLNHETE